MPAPTSISVEIINPVSTVTVSPVEEIDQISVNTVPEVDHVSVDNTDAVTTISFDETTPDYVVDVGIMNFTAPVTSVNGKTGNVVIDYPDIGANPVNNVRFVHTQASIPLVETTGTYAGLYIWTINHNLNFYPNITVFDSGNNIVETHIVYSNANAAIIIMNSAISGTAYLS